MKKQQDIEHLTEQALNSLDDIKQADANPFLYTRVKQRMAHQHKIAETDRNRVMLRLAAVLILFIGINSLSFYALKKNHAVKQQKETTGASAFAEAYQLNTNTDSY